MNNLAFDFIVDKTTNSITVTREFAAELPLVWDAYTKPEIIDQWWAPKPWKTETKFQDFREGGRWQYCMVGPAGEKHWCLLDYITINYHKGFTGRDGFADDKGNINMEMPRSEWEIKFTDKGDVTLVSSYIKYGDLAQLETTISMGFKEGLSMAMVNLDELLPKLKKAVKA